MERPAVLGISVRMAERLVVAALNVELGVSTAWGFSTSKPGPDLINPPFATPVGTVVIVASIRRPTAAKPVTATGESMFSVEPVGFVKPSRPVKLPMNGTPVVGFVLVEVIAVAAERLIVDVGRAVARSSPFAVAVAPAPSRKVSDP